MAGRRTIGRRIRVGLAAALLCVLAGSGVARAQEAPDEETPSTPAAPEATPEAPSGAAPTPTPVEDFAKPMGPPDELNRGTPRGTIYGFIVAARKGDYERAAEFLDLRRLPPDLQGRSTELARQLKVVLDQTLWVDFGTFSDMNEGLADDGLPAWQDTLGTIETGEGSVRLLLQRVPREADGVRIWKVAGSTVARVPDLFEEFGPIWLEAYLPPLFFEIQLLNLELWQWLGLVLLVFGAWLVARLLADTATRILGLLVTARHQALDERIVQVASGPARLALALVLFSLGRRFLALDLSTLEVLSVLERLLWVVVAVGFIFRALDVAVVNLRARAEAQGRLSFVPALVPLRNFARVLIVLIGVLGVLGTLGVNITAAVAGLGVGGIAIALAAQRTLENLFGGLTLYVDQPVRVGDFFRYGQDVGTVEEIGLRSTRVRTLDRTVVTIPNAEFSDLRLENFAKRDRLRLFAMLGVRYETTPDQLRFLLVRLREILLAHPRVTDDPARVRFVGFGAYSLDLEVFAYVDTTDHNDFLAVREDLYLRFMDAVAEAGTGFAFPSSTTYVARDDGLDAEATDEAERRVAAWRDQHELPFPRFAEPRRSALWNSLPWPPPGSPDARPGDAPKKDG